MNSEDSCNSPETGIQLSSDENDVHALKEQLPQILQQNPDIVLIESGMKDHCVKEGEEPECCDRFREGIESAVDTLLAHGIDVVLIGFFQPNCAWGDTNVTAAEAFNVVMRERSANRSRSISQTCMIALKPQA